MLLRITKELTPKSAARLRDLYQKTAFLYNLPANNFLKKDAEVKKITWEQGGWNQYLLQQNIGPIMMPEYELRKIENGSFYCPTRLSNPKIDDLNFVLALTRTHLQRYSSSIKIYVQDTRKGLVVFHLDPLQRENYPSIFALATYFYSKFPSYEKIHKLLLENRDILKQQIGEAYLEDLSFLFSGQEQSQTAKTFTFSQKKPQIEYVKEVSLSEKKEIICLAVATFFVNRELMEIPIVLALKADNLIVWEFNLPIMAPIKKAQFNVFIKEQTELWLESLEARTNFGLSIYEKLKLKILLSNT